MPKQIATAAMEGTRRRAEPRKRLRDDVEEDLSIMGIKNQAGSGWCETVRAGGRLYWKLRPTTDCSA
jgi:hypothetical protein